VSQPASVARTLLRGLAKKCPRCGDGPLYERWNHLLPACPVCGLSYDSRSGDTWFFTYVTTAGLTGVLIVGMLLIRPRNILLGELVLLPAALGLIGGSFPYRKGLAIAIDYLVDRSIEGDPGPGRSADRGERRERM
jgi:uncharacterized protein (DUF983 family)